MHINQDISFLIDTWNSVKSFVPAKERVMAADALLRIFDDYTDLNDVADHLDEFDKVMRNCLIEYYEIFDDQDDYDEDA